MKTAPFLSVAFALLIGAVFISERAYADTTPTLTNFYIAVNSIYGFPTGSHSYTRLTLMQQGGQGTFADCSSPTYNLLGSGTGGPDISNSDFPVALPSPMANTFFTLCAYYYPSGVFTVVGQAELGYDGSDWSTTATSTAIPFQQFYIPAPFSTTSAAIAASSSLWSSMSLASSTISCNGGNLFSDGICAAVSYLFVPNPNVLNAFFSIPTQAAERFPFSWIYGVRTVIDAMSVSSTTAMSAVTYNYHDLGMGSTTAMGNFLPNVTVFSKDTIESYISPTLWATFQTLIAAAMWLGFFWFEFNRARRMARPH